MTNPVILEKVLSYLPAQDIKSWPLVSPVCRQAAVVKKFWYPVMLEQVFTFLSPKDIKTVRLVCRSVSSVFRTVGGCNVAVIVLSLTLSQLTRSLETQSVSVFACIRFGLNVQALK